jgi:hypothetical protein
MMTSTCRAAVIISWGCYWLCIRQESSFHQFMRPRRDHEPDLRQASDHTRWSTHLTDSLSKWSCRSWFWNIHLLPSSSSHHQRTERLNTCSSTSPQKHGRDTWSSKSPCSVSMTFKNCLSWTYAPSWLHHLNFPRPKSSHISTFASQNDWKYQELQLVTANGAQRHWYLFLNLIGAFMLSSRDPSSFNIR